MRLPVSSLSASTTFLRATNRNEQPVMSRGLPFWSSIQTPSEKDLRACRRRTVSLSGLLPTYAMDLSFHDWSGDGKEGLPPPLQCFCVTSDYSPEGGAGTAPSSEGAPPPCAPPSWLRMSSMPPERSFSCCAIWRSASRGSILVSLS